MNTKKTLTIIAVLAALIMLDATAENPMPQVVAVLATSVIVAMTTIFLMIVWDDDAEL